MEIKKLRKRYYGSFASSYTERRKRQRTWILEQNAVREYLSLLVKKRKNPSLLDIPVGTGRFIKYYKELGYSVLGMDVSSDMLDVARKEAVEFDFTALKLKEGDVTKIPLETESVDVVVCIRLMNLLERNDFIKAISEIARVAKHDIVCGITLCPNLDTMNFWNSLKIFSKRLISSIIERLLGATEFVRHSDVDLQNGLVSAGLHIVSRKRIDSGMGGYEYYIFHLKKNVTNSSSQSIPSYIEVVGVAGAGKTETAKLIRKYAKNAGVILRRREPIKNNFLKLRLLISAVLLLVRIPSLLTLPFTPIREEYRRVKHTRIMVWRLCIRLVIDTVVVEYLKNKYPLINDEALVSKLVTLMVITSLSEKESIHLIKRLLTSPTRILFVNTPIDVAIERERNRDLSIPFFDDMETTIKINYYKESVLKTRSLINKLSNVSDVLPVSITNDKDIDLLAKEVRRVQEFVVGV